VPYLPGKVLFQPSHVRKIALERLQPLNDYCKHLISLPSNYSRCYYVIKFFQITNDDISFAIEYESSELNNLNDSLNDNDLNYDEKNMISAPISLKEYHFVADYTVQNVDKEKITFKKDDKVLLIQKYLNGWCWIEHTKQQFCVPYSFIKNCNKWDKDNDIVYLDERKLNLYFRNEIRLDLIFKFKPRHVWSQMIIKHKKVTKFLSVKAPK
jgi:SH3 and PX domain-containing protein 2